jgi:hypothetical protein
MVVSTDRPHSAFIRSSFIVHGSSAAFLQVLLLFIVLAADFMRLIKRHTIRPNPSANDKLSVLSSASPFVHQMPIV